MTFKNTQIIYHQSKQLTKKITVSVIGDGKKYTIWSNVRAETDKNHATIISSIK